MPRHAATIFSEVKRGGENLSDGYRRADFYQFSGFFSNFNG